MNGDASSGACCGSLGALRSVVSAWTLAGAGKQDKKY